VTQRTPTRGGGSARDVMGRLGRVRAASSTATHSGTVVLAAWWWLEGCDLGAHDEEGS
jgi:hypothetical protein